MLLVSKYATDINNIWKPTSLIVASYIFSDQTDISLRQV
jgi:hypothetical protein